MHTTLVAPSKRHPAEIVRLYLLETRNEFLMLSRTKAFTLSTIGFPVMFYVLFGIANKHVNTGNIAIAKYMLGGYAVFGLIGAALFGIGVGVAGERTAGWLELKRSSPMPPQAYLLAKAISAIAFGAIITSVLCAISIVFADVRLSPGEFMRMLAIAVVGAVPFSAMGMLLGLSMPSGAASGIVNLIYLPLSFCSGLWIPIMFLPHWLQKVAVVSPVYHLAQLMENIFGYADSHSMQTHWFALFGFLLLMVGASWIVFQRAEQDA